MKEFGAKVRYWLGGDPPVPKQLKDGYLDELVRRKVTQHEDLSAAAQQVREALKKDDLLPERLGVGRVIVNFFLFIIIVPVFVIGGTFWAALNVLTLFEPGTVIPTTAPTSAPISAASIEYLGESNLSIKIGETLTLRFQLDDENGQPVDGKRVNLTAIPPNQGQLIVRTPAVSNTNGEVEAEFTAGDQPGRVEITAAVNEDPNLKTTVALQIVGKPELQVRPDTQNLPEAVAQGEPFLLQFLIANNGSTPAREVKLHSTLPQNAIFVPEHSENCHLGEGVEIICVIFILNEKAEVKTGFYLRANQPQTIAINPGDYWLTYGENGERVDGTELLVVTVLEPQPTAIRLSAAETRLRVNSVMTETITATTAITSTLPTTTTITVELINENNEVVPVDRQVALSLSPSDESLSGNPLGQLTSNQVNTVQGHATVIFTAGTNPGDVVVTAALDNVTTSLTLNLVQVATLNVLNHVHSEVNINDDNVLLFRLPQGTPLELLSEPENGSQRVAVTVWVPEANISEDHLIVNTPTQIFVGQGRDDPVNQPSSENDGALQPLANNMQIEILGWDEISGLVQIRITGWVNQTYINIDEGR